MLLPLLTEHQPYREAVARLMTEETSPDAVLTRFLKEHPGSLDRPSAELLLTLVYVDQGLLPLARTQLEQVKRSALSPREAAQYDLALAYTILADQRGAADLDEAQRLLLSASGTTPPLSGSRLSSTSVLWLGHAGIFRSSCDLLAQ